MGKRRSAGRQREPSSPSIQCRVEPGPGGLDYEVRRISAARAAKIYRCPGCDHEIRLGTAHVVAWPVDTRESAVEDRRHWHTSCWANRANRAPTRKWS
jgi:hypothetical protein